MAVKKAVQKVIAPGAAILAPAAEYHQILADDTYQSLDAWVRNSKLFNYMVSDTAPVVWVDPEGDFLVWNAGEGFRAKVGQYIVVVYNHLPTVYDAENFEALFYVPGA